MKDFQKVLIGVALRSLKNIDQCIVRGGVTFKSTK